MPIWDKVRQELDRAGRAAQGALDEGKVRLEAFRARQLADRAAQALGYAVFRARQAGKELDADSYARLSGAVAAREADVTRLESQIRDYAARERRTGGKSGPTSAPATAANRDESEPATPAPTSGSVDEPPPLPPAQPNRPT